jgi:hypothetical protein
MKILTASFAVLSLMGALACAQDVQSLEHARFARLPEFGNTVEPLRTKAGALADDVAAQSIDPVGRVKRQTDLNSSPAVLAAKYGKPVKVEPAWCFKGTSYSFQPSANTYIYATTNPEGSAIEDLMYFKFNGPFSEAEKTALYNANVDRSHVWDGDYRGFDFGFDWDGRREVKKLGFERYKHHILYEVNGGHAIVDNVREQDGKTSYQVRTLKQFRFEQTAIKRILEEQKAKGTVTVGALQRVK